MNVQHLVEKWSPVLDHPDLGAIKDSHKRSVVAQLLENQETDCRSGESAGYRNPHRFFQRQHQSTQWEHRLLLLATATSTSMTQFLFRWFVARCLTSLLMISAAFSQ
jgi:hypothetical protein